MSQAADDFLKSRARDVIIAWAYFNFTGLTKNLFAPYKRLLAQKKTTFFDRLSFNLISRSIGAIVRIILLLAGLLGFLLFLLFLTAITVIYLAIPLFSIPAYLDFYRNNFFESDLTSPSWKQKLQNTRLFKNMARFFPDDFVKAFNDLPPLATLKTPSGRPADIVILLAQNFEPLKKYLDREGVKLDTFKILALTLSATPQPQRLFLPIGQSLIFGYTPFLDQYGHEILGHQLTLTVDEKTIVGEIKKTLNRPQYNNVLLVGEPGVGRHTILENLASLISQRLIFLDTVATAGHNLLETKSRLENILLEAKGAGNIIIVIDAIDHILAARDDRVDLSEVLTAVLADSSLPIIGITTPADYNRYIRPNTSLTKYFEKVELAESTPTQTLAILIRQTQNLYHKSKINVSLSAIAEIVTRSNRLISDRNQPEKALVLLGDIASEAKNLPADRQVVTTALVDQIVSQKTKIPLGTLGSREASLLKNLETSLHQRIIGQNEAIREVASALRRARVEVKTGHRPIGSFLFLGPTGVGKTETAKALAALYFGSEELMMRLDMSEYQDNDALKRLIGNTQTETPGILTSMVRTQPYGLLLLDEFEKANFAVHNLFLQVLDEGFLTDAAGHRVSFENTIIIATSNAGAEFIREEVAKIPTFEVKSGRQPENTSKVNQPELSKDLIEYVLEKGLFSPELLNRFDAAVVYLPLTPEEVVKVTALMLTGLTKQLKETKNITLEITEELAAKAALAGYDPQFGARPIRRLIADKIEDGIAQMIINGNLKNGDTFPAATLMKLLEN